MRWTIEICRRCGKKAEWPGCEHWQTHRGVDPNWTRHVVVRTTPAVEKEIQADIEQFRR
jgi:hypothetical protein